MSRPDLQPVNFNLQPATFGEWLRQQRNELKLTRREFAGRVGCSVSALRKIEDGERRPSIQIAGLIANCLDIPPAARVTFIKVARGELSVDRVSPASESTAASMFPRTNRSEERRVGKE